MSLQKVSADCADRATAHALAGVLQELVVPAPDALTLFEQGSGWRVDAYFAEAPNLDALTRQIAAVLGQTVPRLALDAIPDLNWVAMSQAALPPVRAGRFVVHGSHDRARVGQGPYSIEIDAGEAFGTAHHATTWGCLEALDQQLRRCHPRAVLDLGCGSGVLAIAIARAAPRAIILGTDLDRQSVLVARANIRLNRAIRQITVIEATSLGHPRLRRARFDLVVANILARPLIELAPALARAVAPGGILLLSGLLIPQAPEVLAAYRTAGFALNDHRRVNGWSVLVMRRCPSRPLDERRRPSY